MASAGSSLDINLQAALDELAPGLSAYEKSTQQALKRAIRKFMRWLQREISRLIKSRTGVAQKSLKARFKVTLLLKEGYASLWVGLNPIEAQLAGGVRQLKVGTRAAGQLFEGAFYRPVYGKEAKVWRRKFRGKGSTKRSWIHLKRSAPDEIAGRFPVEKMTIDIDRPSREEINRLQSRAQKRFKTLFQQELNYAVIHERKNH